MSVNKKFLENQATDESETLMAEETMSYGGGDGDEGYIAKLRGLPWSATPDEILKFFSDCRIVGGKSGIHMTTSRDGRPSGEAFIELEDAEDLEIAVSKDREHMGNRYIEVFKVNKAEMEWVVKRSGPAHGPNDDGCVRLRGLPFGCSKEEIAQFFTGLEIVPNGITLLTDYSGRSSGEAYVQFVNREVAEKALQKHREKIGHRYIEIFRSSLSEVNGASGGGYQPGGRRGGTGGGGGLGSFGGRPGPYDRDNRFGNGGRFGSTRGSRSYKDYNSHDRSSSSWSSNRNGSDSRSYDSWGGGGGSSDRGGGMHCVHMRGLPFKATESDISDFFKPAFPVNVRLLQDSSGRASGEADVEFASHEDAVRAMSKDKGHMHHRYIELFLNSAGGSSSNGGISYGGLGGRRRM